MWWKNNQWKVIVPLVIVVALAFAFWYGGNTPDPKSSPLQDGTAEIETATPETAASGEKAPEAPTDSTSEESPDETTTVPEEAVPADTQPNVPAAETEMVIDPDTGKDSYQTDPVPEGKPVPVEPQDVTIGTAAYTCTLSISCATILDNLDLCDPEKAELVPEDGWVLQPATVTFYEGESVFNVLQRTCKQQKIHMEYMDTPIYNSAYIEGIHNLYEFDVGELSGWMYSVNGWFPNYGCSRYQLQDGDVICWQYTCDLGDDIGGRNVLDG